MIYKVMCLMKNKIILLNNATFVIIGLYAAA